MELASINIVVKDADATLKTYLKLIGTNNIAEVIKLKGLKDDSETVDGYWLKTRPLAMAIFTPRSTSGRMGDFLQKFGQGIHHIQFHMGQDEFENTYEKYKNMGWPVSRPTYYGKLSEAVFWLEESAPPGVPVKFATKAYHTLKMWPEVIYLDTPQRFEAMEIKEQIIRVKAELRRLNLELRLAEAERRDRERLQQAHQYLSG